MSATESAALPSSLAGSVLEWLHVHPEACSLARLAKQLGLAQSQLRRALTELQTLGLLHLKHGARRTLIELSAHGRDLLDGRVPPGLAQVRRARLSLDVSSGGCGAELDWVIDEAPVALLYNGHAHVVMMLTPVDLEDFAYGYSLAEGIVETADQLQLVEILRHGAGYAIHLAIPQARFDVLLQRATRSAAGTASCGLCGTRELGEALQVAIPQLRRRPAHAIELAELNQAFAQLREEQVLNARCGAAHAAAAWFADGSVRLREDIGRHGAVDKLIGALVREGQRLDVLLLTSRLSFEIMRKAVHVGVHTIAAISAPSALALRIAAEHDVAVWGFVREGQGNRYL